MDVDRLMRDLTIGQLVNVQASIEKEASLKKEELRQMVGRRYRDVIEASNTIRRLTEISAALSQELCKARQDSSVSYVRESVGRRGRVDGGDGVDMDALYRLILLKLLSGTVSGKQIETAGNDGLADVFALLISESLLKAASTAALFLGGGGKHASVAKFLRNLSNQLVVLRLDLSDNLVADLGRQEHWQPATTRLVALALLSPGRSPDELMEFYLQARTDVIALKLKSTTNSLIDIIRAMKQTVQVVNDIFGEGEALQSAVKVVSTAGWCPDTLSTLIEDQTCGYSEIFDSEVRKVNALLAKISESKRANGKEAELKCAEWTVLACSMGKNRVGEMCNYFQRSEELVEFVAAINHILKTEWPRSSILSANTLYSQLFGDVLKGRMRELVTEELRTVRQEVIERANKAPNANPPHLFQRRGAKKFDALAASGVSQDMNRLIGEACSKLKEIMTTVHDYDHTHTEEHGSDNGAGGSITDDFAREVISMLESLLDHFGIPSHRVKKDGNDVCDADGASPSSQRTKSEWLATFRLFLALIQQEPSVIGQCMGRDSGRVLSCNNILKRAIEYSLCKFFDLLLEECKSEITTTGYATAELSLDVAQAMEVVELEGAGKIEVLTSVSPSYFKLLYRLGRELNSTYCVGHLLSSTITGHLSRRLAEILSSDLRQRAGQCDEGRSFLCAQLLFDAKVLSIAFPSEELTACAKLLSSKVNPIELELIAEHIDRNSRLFVQRSQLIFGQLEALTINLPKEQTLLSSYSASVDLTPKIGDIRRLTLIPRLKPNAESDTHITTSTFAGKSSNRGTGDNRTAPNTSFSNLYDKISTSWFKS